MFPVLSCPAPLGCSPLPPCRVRVLWGSVLDTPADAAALAGVHRAPEGWRQSATVAGLPLLYPSVAWPGRTSILRERAVNSVGSPQAGAGLQDAWSDALCREVPLAWSQMLRLCQPSPLLNSSFHCPNLEAQGVAPFSVEGGRGRNWPCDRVSGLADRSLGAGRSHLRRDRCGPDPARRAVEAGCSSWRGPRMGIEVNMLPGLPM